MFKIVSIIYYENEIGEKYGKYKYIYEYNNEKYETRIFNKQIDEYVEIFSEINKKFVNFNKDKRII